MGTCPDPATRLTIRQTGSADGKGRTPFAGSIVLQSRMEPIVQKPIAMTPPPMFPGAMTNNFVANRAVSVHASRGER